MLVFVQRPISAVFIGLCAALVAGQMYFGLRRAWRRREATGASVPPVRDRSQA
jgi:hypothetical protein